MSGTEMLLQAALKAFVPKETAERYVAQAAQVSAIVEGMVKDGALDGIATLISDVREIKESLARIEFQNGRVFAALQLAEQIHGGGKPDGLSGSPFPGPLDAMVAERGPVAVAGPGDGGHAGRELDGVRGVHFTAHNEVGTGT